MRLHVLSLVLLASFANAETLEFTSWNVAAPPSAFRGGVHQGWVVVGGEIYVSDGTPGTTRLVHVATPSRGLRLGPVVGDQLFVIEQDLADRPCFSAADGGVSCLVVPGAMESGQVGVADLAPVAGPELVAFDAGVAVRFTTEFSSGRKLTQVAFFEPSGARTLEVFTPGSATSPAGPVFLTASGEAVLWGFASSLHSWNGTPGARPFPWPGCRVFALPVPNGPALIACDGATFGVESTIDDYLASAADCRSSAQYRDLTLISCAEPDFFVVYLTGGHHFDTLSFGGLPDAGGFCTTESQAFWFNESPTSVQFMAFDTDILDFYSEPDAGDGVVLGARQN